jgi:hypothetical protein
MDLCLEHFEALQARMIEMGYRPASKTASKLRRAYVGKSGRTFSTNEARDWLAEHGYDVPSAGRLSAEMLQVYAEAN